MERYCKNCGANINDATMFCPDCGREIPTGKRAGRCPNCGERTMEHERFCRNCGSELKAHAEKSPGILEKYKIPIITISVILIIAIIAVGAFSLLSPTPNQEVTVDTISFEIPNYYIEDEDLDLDETENGIRYVSKFWQNGGDIIEIEVAYSKSGKVDANTLAKQMGGDMKNMMGYKGYYTEIDDYCVFSFVKDDKVVSVYATSPDLIGEITVL